MFSSISFSVLGAVDALKGYVAAKWLDFQGRFMPLFATCKETIKARTERARFAVKDCCNHARVAVTFAFDYSCQARVRIFALAPLVRDGLALVVGLPITFLGTQVVLGAAQAIGLGFLKLALVAIAAQVVLGLLSQQSGSDIRRSLRGAVANGLLGIGFAAATVGTALDPGPTTSAVVPASATAAMSPAVAAHEAAVTPESVGLDPARPAERRTRRRAAGSNGRA